MIEINNRLLDNDIVIFLQKLLDPEDFGHSVTEEVRNEARKFLGIKPVLNDSPGTISKTKD